MPKMQKDFKIGLGLGLLLAIGLLLWFSTMPNLSTQARALHSPSNKNTGPGYQTNVSQFTPSPAPIENKPQTIEQPPRIHIIQKGDTLSGISNKYYGSPNYWQKILGANSDNLTDPNRLAPGSRLVIPE
jgi:LysM repeat protein